MHRKFVINITNYISVSAGDTATIRTEHAFIFRIQVFPGLSLPSNSEPPIDGLLLVRRERPGCIINVKDLSDHSLICPRT